MYSAVLYLFIITGCLVICAVIFGFCAIPKNRTKLIFVVSIQSAIIVANIDKREAIEILELMFSH